MSMESAETEGGDGPGIGPCRNAEEYAIRFLESTDGTVTPAQVAEAYGCTPGHMQDVLRDAEETERVDIGEYALSTETATGPSDSMDSMESEDVAGPSARDEERAVEGPSAGGARRSEDHGTTDNDDHDDAVVCPAEGCDYEGLPEAVRAHANASIDHDWSELKDDVVGESVEDGEGNEQGVDESEEIDVEENSDDGGEDTDESVGDGPESVAVEAVDSAEEESSMGIPIPVSTTVLFGGVALLLVIFWWYQRQKAEQRRQQQEEQSGGNGPVPTVEGVR